MITIMLKFILATFLISFAILLVGVFIAYMITK